MKLLCLALAFLILGAFAVAAKTVVPASAPVVLGARIGEHSDHTRFVLELSDPVKLRLFTLANPNRMVVELPELLWRLQAPDRPSGRGAIRDYRYGPFRTGESRLIVDLNQPVSARPPVILPPAGGAGYRVVLDLYPTTQAQFERGAGWPAGLRGTEAAPELAALRGAEPVFSRKVIVIDPGHGGIDAGTTGVDGSREKDVVLDEARRLAKALSRRGYTVHLTRDTDTYIPLRQRVSIARSYDADLFISLHADSNPNAAMAGASVYTLSERGSDREAAALAAKENRSDIVAGVDFKGQDETVSHILIDLAQRQTINRSVRFADGLVRQLPAATGLIPRDPHRSAAFAVLKAPDLPAVLVELGYLSNGRDCGQMRDGAWRNAVARAIAAAVDRQFAPELAGG
jgi:N-acetylmuramoyl-L-alanine amidase